MQILHISAWAKTFTQFRMPILHGLTDLYGTQTIYCPVRDPDPHAETLNTLGFELIPGPISPRPSGKTFLEVHSLGQLLRGRGFHALVCHQPMSLLVGVPAARFAGVQKIVYSTGGLLASSGINGPFQRFIGFGENQLMKHCQGILTVNLEDQRFLEAIPGLSRNAFHVGPSGGCGVDLGEFNPHWKEKARRAKREELKVPEDVVLIGFAGRLIREKGIWELLSATSIVHRDSSVPVRVVFFGEGKDRAAFQDLGEALGIADIVSFAGYARDIRDAMAALDIFVLPSYREGFPVALLQAMALGLPCVASNIRGSRELIRGEEVGRLVPPNDHLRLAQALLGMAASSRLRKEIGAAAHLHVSRHYSQSALLPRTIALYQELLAAPPGGSHPR